MQFWWKSRFLDLSSLLFFLQVYIIGGDGTQRGASAIYEVTLGRIFSFFLMQNADNVDLEWLIHFSVHGSYGK